MEIDLWRSSIRRQQNNKHVFVWIPKIWLGPAVIIQSTADDIICDDFTSSIPL